MHCCASFEDFENLCFPEAKEIVIQDTIDLSEDEDKTVEDATLVPEIVDLVSTTACDDDSDIMEIDEIQVLLVGEDPMESQENTRGQFNAYRFYFDRSLRTEEKSIFHHESIEHGKSRNDINRIYPDFYRGPMATSIYPIQLQATLRSRHSEDAGIDQSKQQKLFANGRQAETTEISILNEM